MARNPVSNCFLQNIFEHSVGARASAGLSWHGASAFEVHAVRSVPHPLARNHSEHHRNQTRDRVRRRGIRYPQNTSSIYRAPWKVNCRGKTACLRADSAIPVGSGGTPAGGPRAPCKPSPASRPTAHPSSTSAGLSVNPTAHASARSRRAEEQQPVVATRDLA
jgi:hypothetical protein